MVEADYERAMRKQENPTLEQIEESVESARRMLVAGSDEYQDLLDLVREERKAQESRRCDGCEHYGAEDTSEPDFFACWYPRGDGDFLYGVAVPHDFYCKHWTPRTEASPDAAG